jgi:Nop53 (60S ribosomal biogenesis)
VKGPNKVRVMSKIVKHKIDMMAEKKKEQGLGRGSFAAAKLEKKLEKKAKLQKAKGGFDLWGEAPAVETNPYLDVVAVKTVKKRNVEDARPKAIPAVAVVHAGASYNPHPEDHKAAIEVAAKPEFDKIDLKEDLKRQLSYPEELNDLKDSMVDEEVAEEDVSEAEVESETEATATDAVSRKKKTQAERNKIERFQKLQAQESLMREQKALMKQINSYLNLTPASPKSRANSPSKKKSN